MGKIKAHVAFVVGPSAASTSSRHSVRLSFTRVPRHLGVGAGAGHSRPLPVGPRTDQPAPAPAKLLQRRTLPPSHRDATARTVQTRPAPPPDPSGNPAGAHARTVTSPPASPSLGQHPKGTEATTAQDSTVNRDSARRKTPGSASVVGQEAGACMWPRKKASPAT